MAARIYRTSTAGSTTTWTWSGWIKRAKLSSGNQTLFAGVTDGNNWTNVYFKNDDLLYIENQDSASNTGRLITSRKFRDPGAWMHIVVVWDTTNGTPGDRMRLYVNGVEETAFGTDTNPGSSQASILNEASNVISVGGHSLAAEDFYGEMSHIHFIDGTIYGPTTFGEFDSVSGIWKIKTSPSVTYGTNGFFLKMEDRTNLDLDSSSNAHTFTTTGTLTATEDNPSNNFATLNPRQTNLTLINGNTTATTTNYKYAVSTMAVASGKWYMEMKVTSACMVMGIQDMIKANDGLRNTAIFWSSGSESFHLDGYSKFTNDSYGDISSDASDYPTYTNGDIIGMALDLDNNKLQYSKNGTWYNSADPSSGTSNMETIDAPSTLTSGFYGIVAGDTCGASDGTFYMNFGGCPAFAISSGNADGNGYGNFEYAVPSGYYALCTKNLAEYG